MSFACSVGSFQTGTGAAATTVDVILNLGGLTPVAVWCWMVGRTDVADAAGTGDINFCYGFASDPAAQAVLGWHSAGGVTPVSVDKSLRDDAIVSSFDTAGAINGRLALSSVGADTARFTIGVQFPVSYTVHVFAVAGTEVTANVVAFTRSSTSNTITGVGFTPKYAEIISACSNTSVPSINTQGITSIGRSTVTANHSLSSYLQDGSAASDTAIFADDTMCYKVLFDGSDSSQRTSVISSFNSDGFVLTHNSNDATSRRCYTLCLGGTFQVSLGSSATLTDTTTDIQPAVGFTPKGGFVWSGCSPKSIISTACPSVEVSIGAFTTPFTSNTTISQSVIDVDNQNPSVSATAVRFSDVYTNLSTAGAVEGAMKGATDPVNALGFLMSDADPALKFFSFAVFGAFVPPPVMEAMMMSVGRSFRGHALAREF